MLLMSHGSELRTYLSYMFDNHPNTRGSVIHPGMNLFSAAKALLCHCASFGVHRCQSFSLIFLRLNFYRIE